MDPGNLSHLAAQALYLVLVISAPALLAALAAGVLMGLLQAVTQIQEQALSYVPRLLAVGVALAISGGWMGGHLLRFTSQLWESIPRLVR